MQAKELTVDSLHLTAEQREAVCDTLRSVIESAQFRRSKRYPAFLEFVVQNTLAGNSSMLKERLVAEEVFGRTSDYDPSTDPVVRYTAGEVRKRMALYFSQHPESPVWIDLPLGGYAAEFHFRLPNVDAASAKEEEIRETPNRPEVAEGVSEKEQATRKAHMWGRYALLAAAVLLVVGGLARWNYTRTRPQRDFWWPVLQNDVPAIVVVGEGAYPTPDPGPNGQQPAAQHQPAAQPSQPANSVQSGNPLPDEGRLVLANALTVSGACNAIRGYGRECKVLTPSSATFSEIHNSSIVLIGAFDNALTTRFLSPLRYQLRSQESSGGVLSSRMIVDQSRPGEKAPWEVGRDRPSGETGVDYAIVARFHSDLNDGMAVVIAGLGPQATHSAGDYITSPGAEGMREIASRAPKNWAGINFEAVLQIDLMQGSPGHVQVLATQFW